MTRTEAARINQLHKPCKVRRGRCAECGRSYPCNARKAALDAMSRFTERQVQEYQRQLVLRHHNLNQQSPARGVFGRF